MTVETNLYFEIAYSGNIVRVEAISLEHQNSPYYYDNNWINSKVYIKCGQFQGQFTAQFQTVDFESFKQELKKLYADLKSTAHFTPIEHQLELIVTGDGTGHLEMQVIAKDNVSDGAELQYTMTLDQTLLKPVIDQLQSITERFPISGDFKIKNEP
jgi:hypothetical protein